MSQRHEMVGLHLDPLPRQAGDGRVWRSLLFHTPAPPASRSSWSWWWPWWWPWQYWTLRRTQRLKGRVTKTRSQDIPKRIQPHTPIPVTKSVSENKISHCVDLDTRQWYLRENISESLSKSDFQRVLEKSSDKKRWYSKEEEAEHLVNCEVLHNVSQVDQHP